MSYFLRNTETGEKAPCSVLPTWFSGLWQCGEFAVTDTSGAAYEAVQEPVALPRHITVLAFLDRFTDAEAIKFDLASIGATVQAASMRRFMQKVNAAHYIDLDREDTRQGVIALEENDMLDALGRAMIILDAEILDSERYQGE
jgi:hypothetical protein